MVRTKVSLLVDENNLHRITDVIKHAKGAGLEVDQVLEQSGVVTGSMDHEKVESLRKIRGIASVEEDRKLQIAPPESELQ